MNAKPFLDSNIIVYAFINDLRRQASEALIAAGGIISIQVLNEFVKVSRYKLHVPWTEIEHALKVLETLLDPPMPLSLDIHKFAVQLARHHKFAFYDSLIVAAASKAECSILYSEDMQDGRIINGVRICNPFVHSK